LNTADRLAHEGPIFDRVSVALNGSTSTREPASWPVLRGAAIGGAAVGLLDGVRVVLSSNTGARLATIALVLGTDLPIAVLVGAVLAALFAAARAGLSRREPRAARLVGWLLAGVLAAAPTYLSTLETAHRKNRFLAGVVVAVVSAGAAGCGALLAPLFARLVTWPFTRRQPPVPRDAPTFTPAGLFLAVPTVALAVEGVVFLLVQRTGIPVQPDIIARRAILVSACTVVLPIGLGFAARAPFSMRWVVAAPLALVVCGGFLSALIVVRWVSDFQFVPWTDILVVLVIAVATAVCAWAMRRWPPRPWRELLFGMTALVAGAGLMLWGAESEPARKAALVRAGLVRHVLPLAQDATDRDSDGYSRLFGGGDCDDDDAAINPGAIDWPGDGVDQNCDGRDTSADRLGALPFHPVPESVPTDLRLLFVTIDALRADHLGAYGYKRQTSPRIDELARDGVLFENGWANAPSTRYSMPAITTSRWPSVVLWDQSISWPRMTDGQVTLPETLKALGYTTGALYSFNYFEKKDARGFERGVDYYDSRRASLHVNVDGPKASSGSSAREMADDTIAFLREHGRERFFLRVHFYDPHLNYERHPEGPDFGSEQVDLYDGEIRFVDFQLGRVLDELAALGLRDTTAVIVSADHGESLGEHGIKAHGFHLYAQETKVPIIMRVPGIAPRVVDTPVSHVDLAPTILNLARGPAQASFLGRSLVDVMVGAPEPPAPRPVFQEVSYGDDSERRALVTATHHLLWNWTPDNTTECFDIAHDPGEVNDLWGTKSGEPTCSSLKAQLQDMITALALPPGYGEKMKRSVFAPGVPAPDPAAVRRGRLGDWVAFRGYDISNVNVAPGQSVRLTYHFESLAPVPKGWSFFFHMRGPPGVRNLDHVPVEGAFPPDRWRPGMNVLDTQTIDIAPEAPQGEYVILLGMYEGDRRLPVTPADVSEGKEGLKVVTLHVRSAP
jgi:arylsulfatase A-like enzyme